MIRSRGLENVNPAEAVLGEGSQMRIVGGIFKGRRLMAPAGYDVRPTGDRTRESLFNIITHGLAGWEGELEDASVIDLFCGTGALGLEALSRGAAHVTLVDNSVPVLSVVKKNLALGIETAKRTTILRMDATRLAPPPRSAGAPCDIAFLDPPYGSGLALPALGSLKTHGWLSDGGLAVIEVGSDESPNPPLGYAVLKTRSYGAAKIVFLLLRNS